MCNQGLATFRNNVSNDCYFAFSGMEPFFPHTFASNLRQSFLLNFILEGMEVVLRMPTC